MAHLARAVEPRKKAKVPPLRDDRIILHFDYDCFYAQVVENRQPALRGQCVGVAQKSILATCNYEARRRGVRKLMLISEARRVCPDLVLADGEDLSPFRDVSKRLYALLRPFSWAGRAERLGLDEVFLDVTDVVAYNISLLNYNALADSFFCLSAEDPENGFAFDATALPGCVAGADLPSRDDTAIQGHPAYMRLLLAAHLARYLRLRIEEEGYTSACGIATNKLLSKLAGSRNRPRSQTTLLGLCHADVLSFMDAHALRKVPGIGPRMTRLLESHAISVAATAAENGKSTTTSVTVGEVRNLPDMSPQLLETILGGPGAEKGIGQRVWGLLHGVDNAEVKSACDVPAQISIEDTYKGLNSLPEIEAELRKLSASLLARMRVDLVEADPTAGGGAEDGGRRWMAHPKTLRLTTRPRTSPADGRPYNFNRASRSQPLPGYVFSLSAAPAQLAERLVADSLLPMFRRLHPDAAGGWNVGLLNVCVASMVLVGNDGAAANGRDISAMFRRQEDVLKEFRVYSEAEAEAETETETGGGDEGDHHQRPVSAAVEAWDPGEELLEPAAWTGDDGAEPCLRCGHLIPGFALAAHMRYHDTGL